MSSITSNKRIAKNTLFLYFRMLLIMLVTLYTSRVVLQVLGVEDFGIYNVVGGFVSMLSFLNTSIANGFQRFFNLELGREQTNKVKQLFSVSLSIQLLLSLIILFAAETLGLWFLNTEMNIVKNRMIAANWVYQCSVLMLIITILRAPYSAIIIANEKMNFYAYISIVEVIGQLLIVFLLAEVTYDKLASYGILMLSITIIVFAIYVFFVSRRFRYLSMRPVMDRILMKQMLSFSGWNLFGSSAHLMKSQGVNVLLNLFFGPTVNAARGIAYQIQSGVTMFITNFQLAARPQMIKSYAVNDISNLMILFYRISRFSFFLLWALSLPLLLKMDFILQIWLGNNVPPLTTLFAILALLIALAEVFATPLTTIVHATGKMKKFQTTCSSIILSIVPISYIILKLGFPPESVMYVSLIIVFFVHAIRLILLRKLILFSIQEYALEVLLPCLKIFITTLIPAFTICYYTGSLPVSIIQLLITGLLSLAIIYFIGLKNSEQIFIRNTINDIYAKLNKRHNSFGKK